jgi:uncharacterized membrane protein YeaQ/YmgE (transglycosylase-associated protein family)
MLIMGLIIGALAKLIMPGRDGGGIIMTMVLGVVGAMLGGFVGRALGFYQQGQSAGWFMAILGAVIVLAIYRAVTGRSHRVIHH